MRGRPLVEGDELVGFRAGESAPAVQEMSRRSHSVGGRSRIRRDPWSAAAPGMGAYGSVLLRRAAGQLGRLSSRGAGKVSEGWRDE